MSTLRVVLLAMLLTAGGCRVLQPEVTEAERRESEAIKSYWYSSHYADLVRGTGCDYRRPDPACPLAGLRFDPAVFEHLNDFVPGLDPASLAERRGIDTRAHPH